MTNAFKSFMLSMLWRCSLPHNNPIASAAPWPGPGGSPPACLNLFDVEAHGVEADHQPLGALGIGQALERAGRAWALTGARIPARQAGRQSRLLSRTGASRVKGRQLLDSACASFHVRCPVPHSLARTINVKLQIGLPVSSWPCQLLRLSTPDHSNSDVRRSTFCVLRLHGPAETGPTPQASQTPPC